MDMEVFVLKKIILQMILVFFVVSFFAFYYFYLHWTWRQDALFNRAQIAKMLCALEYDDQMLTAYMQEINVDELPDDISLTSWYTKYVVGVLDKGWMVLDDSGQFCPGKIFTYGDLKCIMDAFYLREDMLSFSIRYRQLDAYVSKVHWCEVYSLLCVNQNNIIKTERIFMTSPSTSKELQAWEVETDDGIKIAEGLVVDDYLNQKVEVFEFQDQILCVIRVLDSEHIQKNETESTDDRITKANDEEPVVRVLLHSENSAYNHERVELTSDEDFYIQIGLETKKKIAGDVVDLGEEMFDANDEDIIFESQSRTGTIRILSIERACGNPEYKGKIILKKGIDGIWIVNEVNLEDYVAGVISSEMPETYDIEALKAQAVCARTYAVRSMQNGFQSYPADVDDTVSSQVYNNQSPTKSSESAAEDTKGMILMNQNEIANVYFFSTSCGHTSSPEEVWYNGAQKEADTAVTTFLSDDPIGLNLIKEEEFRSFINLEQDVDYYEDDLPWFRWNVHISDDVIEEKLLSIQNIDIGELVHVEVVERAESGVLKALSIDGTKASCVLYGQYQIRQILSPQYSEIILHNGDTVKGGMLLPSGYFYFDVIKDNSECTSLHVFGGGYGHGCGMSQNGAMKMAEEEKKYDAILNSFFPGTCIEQITIDLCTNKE